jgi:hypothetical protein
MNPEPSLAQSMFLFLSLASLLRWRHRREDGPHRLRRGLRTYLASRTAAGRGKSLMTKWSKNWYGFGTLRTRLCGQSGLQ